jgi:hypothetical protein
MRGCILVLSLASLVGVVSCTPSAKTPAGQLDGKNSCVIADGGAPVLRLTLQKGDQAFPDKTNTFVSANKAHRFYVWVVSGARTLDEAAARVPDVIKSEFVGFKQTGAKDVTVAGAAARQLAGTGTEADDGDPGNAEVVLFAVGGRVFAACVHGEGDAPALHRDFMMSAIQTARVP